MRTCTNGLIKIACQTQIHSFKIPLSDIGFITKYKGTKKRKKKKKKVKIIWSGHGRPEKHCTRIFKLYCQLKPSKLQVQTKALKTVPPHKSRQRYQSAKRKHPPKLDLLSNWTAPIVSITVGGNTMQEVSQLQLAGGCQPKMATWRKECHQVPKQCLAFSSLNKRSSPIIKTICVPGYLYQKLGAGVLYSVSRTFAFQVWGPAGGHRSSLSGWSSEFPHSGNAVMCRCCIYPNLFSPYAVRIWP